MSEDIEEGVITLSRICEIEKYLEAQKIAMWAGVLVLTKRMWVAARKHGLCSFSDEELEKGFREEGVIKTGYFKGIGNVHMAIDRRVGE